MLLTFVLIYFAATLLIGLLAARRVKSGEDFILAGRSLPAYISTAALFATWFGSETVLGASSVMAKEGLMGVIEDPFGASLCLVILGMFFARPLYRMNILTFGDFYGQRYGRRAELIASVFLILTYIGWISAQMVALGIIMQSVSGLPVLYGILIGTAIVVIYTFFGGMWAVSITDFIQMIFIILGLVLAAGYIVMHHSFPEMLAQLPEGHLSFYRPSDATGNLNYFAAWITLGFGSIPQQDLFQRVMSAKSERTAVFSAYAAALLYLTIALIPLLLALYARVFLPELIGLDAQLMLPQLIMRETPLPVQILFFGALLSAVMSTASGAILAPASVLSENILGHFILKRSPEGGWNKGQLLRITRYAVVGIAMLSLSLALFSHDIYRLVGESNALGLVALFVPLTAGIYWKKASRMGGILAMLCGTLVWISAYLMNTDINPMLYGFAGSIAGLLSGSMLWKNFGSVNS